MNIELSFEEKYEAIGKKETRYEGIFVTGVKTTGIFCRPSCRARKPKAENVVFYQNADQAIQHGFRPCKICKPVKNEFETPDFIKNIVQELEEYPQLKIKDQDLLQRGIEPNQIRRWFKKHYKMTFHAYQRKLRINNAVKGIKMGHSVTDAAYNSGFESLSGFNERFRILVGNSPSMSKDKLVINSIRFSTKLGPMVACTSQKGLCLLEFIDKRNLEKELEDLQMKLNGVILPGKNQFLDQVQSEIKEYMEGDRTEFSLPIDAPGTPFQQSVWNKLLEIPFGTTCSYLDLAKEIKNPKAVRAVAQANGRNRIAIVIPCHRVIGSNGKLTGYAGGLDRKRWLLDLSRVNNKLLYILQSPEIKFALSIRPTAF